MLMSACAAKFVESWVQLLVPPARSKQLGGQLVKVSANGMAWVTHGVQKLMGPLQLEYPLPAEEQF
jgi:hypothetical protein